MIPVLAIDRPPFNTKVMVMVSKFICQKPSSRLRTSAEHSHQFKAFKLKYLGPVKAIIFETTYPKV